MEFVDLLDRQILQFEVHGCDVDVSAAPLKISKFEVLPARARATLTMLAMLALVSYSPQSAVDSVSGRPKILRDCVNLPQVMVAKKATNRPMKFAIFMMKECSWKEVEGGDVW